MYKLSVVIPVFNEEAKISRALESVLSQRTDFNFEVIVVDDASTDETVSRVSSYVDSFPNVSLIALALNKGKGGAVRDAYALAKGKYVHVLDADDYLTSVDKFQKQVDILDGNSDVFCVAHNTMIINANNEVNLFSNPIGEKVYSYEEIVNPATYFHTSSQMLRRVPGGLPEVFESIPALRGDVAFLYFHALAWKGTLHYLPDVASVYDFHGSGLWSGLSAHEKIELNRKVLMAIRDHLVANIASPEHDALNGRLDALAEEEHQLSTQVAKVDEPSRGYSFERMFGICLSVAAVAVQPEAPESLFKGMHTLEVVDQICETLGTALFFDAHFSRLNNEFADDVVAFLVSVISPTGGGVYREITSLVDMHLAAGESVVIVVSDPAASNIAPLRRLYEGRSVEIIELPEGTLVERVDAGLRVLASVKASRLYPFITHHDIVGSACLQSGLASEIVLDFVYDHGTSLALSNSSIDTIIFKTFSQASACSAVVMRSKTVIIRPLVKSAVRVNPYVPFVNGFLTTASAAARAYKVQGQSRLSYARIIPEILALTSGRHVHIGPLSAVTLQLIAQQLEEQGVPQEAFHHIPYREDFQGALTELGIDAFVTPFPVPSAQISLLVMGSGIPLICFEDAGRQMPQARDFCDPEQFSWEDKDQLLEVISSLNLDTLNEKSASAFTYFMQNNDWELNAHKMMQLSGVTEEPRGDGFFVVKDVIRDDIYDLGELRLILSMPSQVPQVDVSDAREQFLEIPSSSLFSAVPPSQKRFVLSGLKKLARKLLRDGS